MDLSSIIVITLAVTFPGSLQAVDRSTVATMESGVGSVTVEESGVRSFDARALADRLVGDATADVAPPPASTEQASAAGTPPVASAPRPLKARLSPAPPPLNQPTATSWWQRPELRIVGLLLVMGAAAWMLKRWKIAGVRGVAGRPAGVMSVLARYPFGRGGALVLIECGPRIILLHQHAGRGGEVTALSEFTAPEDLATLRTRLGAIEREAEPGFAEDLEKHLGAYDRTGRPVGSGVRSSGAEGVMDMVDLTRRRPRWGLRSS